ncbi:MAG: MurR/RpiR family transcriptional regulator [Spirochaetaceae bacterium]|nr:MurR/RpiR family transcriptional regulator [Spirochaetaceae bacterium]
MNDNIFVRIEKNYEMLSRAYKDIANYIKENFLEIPFLSILELSKRTGVSIGSVTGFCKAINYTGYPDFQKDVRKLVQNEMIPIRRIQTSIASSRSDEDILLTVIEQNIENLNNTYSSYLKSSFEKAVDLIRHGRKVYILGMRSAYSVAYYLYFMLSDIMDNVELLSLGTSDLYDRIMNIDNRDILVSIGFEKYTRATCEVTEFFHSHSCRVIALTDNQSSPLSVMADTTLLSNNNSSKFSYVSAMAICNALVIRIGIKSKKKVLATMERREQLHREKKIHL